MGNGNKPNYVSIQKSPQPLIKYPKISSSNNYNVVKPTRKSNKAYGLLDFSSSVNQVGERNDNGNKTSSSYYFNYSPKKNENTAGKKIPNKGLRFSTSVDDIQMSSNHFNTKKNENKTGENENLRGELKYSYSANDIQENTTQNQYGKGSFSSINDADYFNYSPRGIENPNGKTGNSYEEMTASTSVNDVHTFSPSSSFKKFSSTNGKIGDSYEEMQISTSVDSTHQSLENSSKRRSRFLSTNGKAGDSYEDMQASTSVNNDHEGVLSNDIKKDYYYCSPAIVEKEKEKPISNRKISNPCYGVLNFTKEDKTNDTANDGNCDRTEKKRTNNEVTNQTILGDISGDNNKRTDNKLEIHVGNTNATTPVVDHPDTTTTTTPSTTISTTTASATSRQNLKKRQSRYSTSSCYDNHRYVLIVSYPLRWSVK